MGYSKNFFTLGGARLTRDAELKYANNGNPRVTFGVAINKQIKSNGEKKDIVRFFDCVMWGKYPEALHPKLKKGVKVILFGEIGQRTYQANDGTNRNVVELELEEILFMGDDRAYNGGGGNAYDDQPDSYDDQSNGNW